MMRKPILFIVWADTSRRAETLSAELGAQTCYVYERRLNASWQAPLRYFIQSWQTWHLLNRERPAIVFVQSPPIFAPLTVAFWCMLQNKFRQARTSYVLDCHPSTFHSHRWNWALPILRFLSNRADFTLSSNMHAEDILRRWNVKGFFLADGVPSLCPATGDIGSQGELRVAFISTFDRIEPIAEMFAAARLLPHVTFYVTGDPALALPGILSQKPENVILTGFLRGGDYTALLKNVHGLLILTTRSIDLSCGAYEAVAAEQPAIVSTCSEDRLWFTRGFIYVDNTPEAIAKGVKELLDKRELLIPEVIALRSELFAKRQPRLKELAATLQIAIDFSVCSNGQEHRSEECKEVQMEKVTFTSNSRE
jgi:glycosyltransferase involved in cell wall biosynthesis